MDAEDLSVTAAESPLTADDSITVTLIQQHDQIRRQLAAAAKEPWPIGKAVRELADLCLAHFEHEERIFLPMVERLQVLASSEELPQGLEELQHEMFVLNRHHERLELRHTAIILACKKLHDLSEKDGNAEVAQLVETISAHEAFEDSLLMAVYDLGVFAKYRLPKSKSLIAG